MPRQSRSDTTVAALSLVTVEFKNVVLVVDIVVVVIVADIVGDQVAVIFMLL